MAEDREQEDPTVSPLFDKMDALLARHRGSRGQADIPVLSEEADLEELSIPILTEVVDEQDLMFPPPLAPFPLPAALQPATPSPDKFLEFPLFELEPIPDEPQQAPALFDAEANASHQSETAESEHPALPQSVSEVTELETAPYPDATADSVAVTETELLLDVPELVFPDELAPLPANELAQLADWPADDAEDVLTLVEADHPEATQLALQEIAPPTPQLDEAAVAELIATVGAQIAVEISTEVAQLARQHFSNMMNTFYADALRKLTDEISRDMEMCLAPRIHELVREELKRQGLVK